MNEDEFTISVGVSHNGDGTVNFEFRNIPIEEVGALFHYIGSDEGQDELADRIGNALEQRR